MNISQRCEVNFTLDGKPRHCDVNIEEVDAEGKPHFRAVINTAPLRGTYGGFSEDSKLALDYLNLAMQAEGADDIVFSCPNVD